MLHMKMNVSDCYRFKVVSTIPVSSQALTEEEEDKLLLMAIEEYVNSVHG